MLRMPGRARVKRTSTKNPHDGFPSLRLLWTSASAVSAPEGPFAFTVTKVLHSEQELCELIQLLIFSSPLDFPQDTNQQQRNISLL